MRISEILKSNKPSLSIEVFPPKTDTALESVELAVREIAALKPSFMSVTYGAGGGTSQYTAKIAKEIMTDYNVTALAHLTCVSSTRDGLHKQVELLKQNGIENVLALRGDIPESKMNEDRSKWDFRHATDLVTELKNLGTPFCIGGACYPEKHPESKDKVEDIKYLKEKADLGCEFFTTQMFFDNNLLYNFLYRVREAGITVPVVAGIMPITNANQVYRAINLSGSLMPQRFKSIVDRFGDNPEAMMQAGIAYATEQIIDLFANNVNHVHLYSMNKPEVAKEIINNLSDILEK